MDPGDPALLLRRRAGRRVGAAGAGSPSCAGNGELARRALAGRAGRRRRSRPVAADLRPRAARALPEHAAGVQGHLADERRLVDPRRLGATTAPGADALGGPFPARRAAPSRVAGGARACRSSTYTAALHRQHGGARSGTRRAASCRSCSPPARRRARGRRWRSSRRPRTPRPARRLAVGGAAAELVPAELMERRLGELAEPYRQDEAGTLRDGREGADRRRRGDVRPLGPPVARGRRAAAPRWCSPAPPRALVASSAPGSSRPRTRSTSSARSASASLPAAPSYS